MKTKQCRFLLSLLAVLLLLCLLLPRAAFAEEAEDPPFSGSRTARPPGRFALIKRTGRARPALGQARPCLSVLGAPQASPACMACS